MSASAEGLDVSGYQGQFNWAEAVKKSPGLAFGIYRLTQGLGHDVNSPDPDARWNCEQIRAQRLHHGAYHFADPTLSGEAQAQYFVSIHAEIGLGTTDMLWYDNETAKVGNTVVSPAAVSAVGVAFMRELDKLAPHNPRGVYTFIDFARYGYCAGLEEYPLWLAFPSAKAPQAPMPWTRWTFWQWGLRNGVDADAYNGTVAQLGTWLGSFSHPAAPGPPQHIRATGLKTWGQLAAEYGTTVHELVHATVRHEDLLSSDMQHSLDQLGGDRPRPGTEIWTP